VAALEVRASWVAPVYETLPLGAVRSPGGDVLLVDDAQVLEPQDAWAPGENALQLVGADCVTQTGEFLGKVRCFSARPARTHQHLHWVQRDAPD
jgi:hypothetical protein